MNAAQRYENESRDIVRRGGKKKKKKTDLQYFMFDIRTESFPLLESADVEAMWGSCASGKIISWSNN